MQQVRLSLLILLLFSFILGQTQSGVFVRGKAIYKSGTLIENAKVTLMDTTEKVIAQTTTSKKFLKRFGGGSFVFPNIDNGTYDINIKTGEDIDINHRFDVKGRSVNLGTLYPFKEIPVYKINDYSVNTSHKMRNISSVSSPSDTVNIKHVIVDLNGNAFTVLLDSIIVDTVFYTLKSNSSQSTIQLDQVYFIYNDYGIFLYQSRSLRDRMKDLQKRDGYIIFLNGDTLKFDHIFFEPVLQNPEVATFQNVDSMANTQYHSIFDIHKIRTGPAYIGESVEKGFWSGLYAIGGLLSLQIISQKSIDPLLKFSPDLDPPVTGSYGTMVTIIPVITLGQIAYDYYRDKRSNYIIPAYEKAPYPSNMFVFSTSEWIWKKFEPIVRPIKNSRPVKWWSQRKLRKVQKEVANRKSASD